jgi:hypothetical protein
MQGKFQYFSQAVVRFMARISQTLSRRVTIEFLAVQLPYVGPIVKQKP